MSRWIEWIKEFAKKTNKSYGCALSDPECSASYRRKYGVAKKVPAKVERERMGMEDKDAPAPPPPPPPPVEVVEAPEPVVEAPKPAKKARTKKVKPVAEPVVELPPPPPAPPVTKKVRAKAKSTSVEVFPRPELTPDEKEVAELYHQLEFLVHQPFPGMDMPSGPALDEALKKHYAPRVVIEKKLYNKYGIIPEDTNKFGLAEFRRNSKEAIISDLHKFGLYNSLDWIKDKYDKLKHRAGFAGKLPHTSMELKRIKNIIDVAERFGSETIGRSLSKFFNKKFGVHGWEYSSLTSPRYDSTRDQLIMPKWNKQTKTFDMY